MKKPPKAQAALEIENAMLDEKVKRLAATLTLRNRAIFSYPRPQEFNNTTSAAYDAGYEHGYRGFEPRGLYDARGQAHRHRAYLIGHQDGAAAFERDLAAILPSS